jgi:hypothetical protein
MKTVALTLFLYVCIFSVTSQLPGANGYTGGKVVLIDTENTLYPLLKTLTGGDNL